MTQGIYIMNHTSRMSVSICLLMLLNITASNAQPNHVQTQDHIPLKQHTQVKKSAQSSIKTNESKTTKKKSQRSLKSQMNLLKVMARICHTSLVCCLPSPGGPNLECSAYSNPLVTFLPNVSSGKRRF